MRGASRVRQSRLAELTSLKHLIRLGIEICPRMTSRESSEDIDNAAADWAARLDGAPLSEAENLALEAWAAADPRRRGALARALAVLAHFDRAKALGPQFDPRAHAPPKAAPRVGRRTLLAGGALAAGLGAAALIAPGILRARSYATGKGEIRSVLLQDGTVIWLNTDSRLRVDYSRSRRAVSLLAGEALFDVAKDSARPFLVRAEALAVRAVGTSFSVSRLAGEPIEVIVREGTVDVAHAGGDQAAPVRLPGGTRALATSSGPLQVSVLDAQAVARSLSWTTGMLDFNGATLAEAAARFARYSDDRIVIDDPAVAQRTVTGRFAATKPAAFAQAVALSMNLQARPDGRSVHLSR